jgi:hypothetical protein
LPVDVKEHKFDVEETLAASTEFHATGTVHDDDYEMEGIVDKRKEPLAKVKVTWSIGRNGWPTRAEGEVTDASGTVKFSLRGD